MTTDTVTLFLALLAVVAQVIVVVAVGFAVAGRLSPAAARAGAHLRESVRAQAPAVAWCVAAVATAGSLYLSEGAHFVPCRLCWIQRGFMYPLVAVLALVAWRPTTALRRLAAAMAGAGGLVSIYHVLVERFPSLEGDVCDPANPCTLIWVERLGYLTIPTMALCAFALILTMLAISR